MTQANETGGPLRRRVHDQLEPAWRSDGVSWLNRFLIAAILASVAVALLETEPTVISGRENLFRAAELGFAAIFAVEYAVRFWTAAEDGGWRARLRWIVSPAAIIDLLAILPAIFAAVAAPSYLLRLARLLRILRLAKLGRFSKAWSLVARAIASRRYELLLTFYGAVVIMIVSATLLYLAEGPVQPEKFGSIPRALWWSVVTLTTIGYGDVYPETLLGRVFAAMTAVFGIGLIAAPTGILAAAFSDALQAQRDEKAGPDED
ncbi:MULTISPECIES: ion transporter [unclassified Phenylobacterium]|uniref:ion transporter n=1 Tax=unclassified Phenylobacterium TaxID=2640670 RepID=UPI00083A83ED|nr:MULTISPECIES: ion transporter [unclassified Phenylobacterium]